MIARPAAVALRAFLALCAFASTMAFSQFTHAALNVSSAFNGRGNWSLDAVGSNDTPIGTVSAVVPVGSTVERAFLYVSNITGNSTAPTVTLAGTTYTPGMFTDLLPNNANIRAFRTDVTAQMIVAIGGGSASPFSFLVNSEAPINANIDGEMLAIIYSNPAESERTIAFLDGFSATTGQTTTVNLTEPLPNPTTPGFEALVSLGIGFSAQSASQNQSSRIDVGGRRLTTSAGGHDDGILANGGLITVGGIGDSPLNPVDPFAPPSGPNAHRTDDELYNLALGNGVNPAPFINQGDTSFTFETINPSNDDNIFFLGVNITAEAGVDNIPPDVEDDEISVFSGATVNYTFEGIDPDAFPNPTLTWSFEGLTGPGVLSPPSFDANTQQFAWNTAGSALGTYEARARASDGLNSAVGVLTIHVLIPEPSSALLLLIGAVAVVGRGSLGCHRAG